MKKKRRPYVMTARLAKAEATRARICESVMALYHERSIDDFTLDDVASRAGTTVQTVLRQFNSKDNLIIAALDRTTKPGSPLLQGRPGGFLPSPPGDVAAAVTAIYDLYESVGDFVVQRLAEEQRRPALQAILAQGRSNHAAWVKAVFAPQLAQRSGNARTQLFQCLMVATDVYAWKILRRDLGLTRPAAEATVRHMITALTTREKNNGTLPLAELVGRRQPAA
jgi:AcrR family transcriptional regulator